MSDTVLKAPPHLSAIPSKPGVYTFRDHKGNVLYVGKAKNLRTRLRSYFKKSPDIGPRKTAMVQEVSDIDYVVTGNELEAFILEANMIKQHKPKFNIILRDDKNYPYLRLTVQEEWPVLEVVRKIRQDGALYFGPYIPAASMRETLAFISRHFQIRDCRYSLEKPRRPCIQHQMGRCCAPCAGDVNKKEYRKIVNEVRLFLSGQRKHLVGQLRKRMCSLSDDLRFEEAAKIRDRLQAIEQAWQSQKIIAPELGDIDVISFFREDEDASFRIFFVRNGAMIGDRNLLVRKSGFAPDSELLHSFLQQFYAGKVLPPDEIVVPLKPEGLRGLEKWLASRKGSRVKVTVPSPGKKRELVTMAAENARSAFHSGKKATAGEMLQEVKAKLGLLHVPQDIGAFDVSMICGTEAVGSFVYWSEGHFRKEHYRTLRIRNLSSVDDYSMMEETISRVITGRGGIIPDLLIIDGGKGHLETARRTLRKHRSLLRKKCVLVAVAKDPDRAFLTSGAVIGLEDGSTASLLLRSIRDEAHRCAIGYHRKLRDRELLQSPLENIPGIGKKRRLELLRVFGSIEDIKRASADEIGALKGFHKKIAEKLLRELGRTE